MYETKCIEQAVVSVHQHSEIGEKVLVVHSYINYKGKMILTKEEAMLLLVELYKFVKMEEDTKADDKIISTEKDAEVFYKAVLGNSTPNENLVEAAKLYKSKQQKYGKYF